jgi:hypothetical protein
MAAKAFAIRKLLVTPAEEKSEVKLWKWSELTYPTIPTTLKLKTAF